MRGHDPSAHPALVRRGVELHHAIDALTDSHPAFAASRRHIEGPLRRCAELTQDENPTEVAQATHALLGERRAPLDSHCFAVPFLANR